MGESLTLTESAEPVQAEFVYWAENRRNDPSEIEAIINGVCDSTKRVKLPVHNIRASVADLNHEKHGFQIVDQESEFLQRYQTKFDFSDFQSHCGQYCRETIAMVTSELGIQSAAVLNIVFRETSSEQHSIAAMRNASSGNLSPPGKPFHVVHNDYSAPGARASLRAMLPNFFEETNTLDVIPEKERDKFFGLRSAIISAEQEAITRSGASDFLAWDGANYEGPRWAIFSIWRPIELVQQDPLAILDPNSLFASVSHHEAEYKTYIRARFPIRKRAGLLEEFEYSNIMPLLPRGEEAHKWLWLENQQPREVTFLKLFDSEAWKEGSRVMPCGPHSAFSLPGAGTSPRKSIETRVLVIW